MTDESSLISRIERASHALHTSHLDDLVSVHACLEIVDSIFLDYRCTLTDNTADLSSAALVVEGPELGLDLELGDIEVEISKNGEPLASARGEAALGHPLLGVVWLSEHLAALERRVDAGQLIITGGLTRAFALDRGDQISGRFGERTEVAIARATTGDRVETSIG